MTEMSVDIRKLIDRYVGIPLLACITLLCRKKGRKKTDSSLDTEIRSVLAIYLSGIGDTVMIASCLKQLAKRYPSARVSFLASSQNYEIIKENPYISQGLCLDKTKGIGGFTKSLVQIIKTLRRSVYDIVIDFEQFLRLSAIISVVLKAKRALGFETINQYRHYGYTDTFRFDPSKHTLYNFFSLLGLLEMHQEPGGMEEIYVSKRDKALATTLVDQCGISEKDVVVGIHPGSGDTARSRRWEPANFTAIANLLLDNYDAKILLTGTRDESMLINCIWSGIKDRGPGFNLAGKVTLAQLPYVIRQCHVFLSNDTGPLHIAAAMKVPVIALFGPNTPLRYGPIGNKHYIIYKDAACSPCIIAHEGVVPQCRDNKCMKDITVDEVWAAIRSAVSGHPQEKG